MNKQLILIHIGYHKTGSSFLQKLVFANQNCGFYCPWSRQDYFEKLILVNPFSFDSSDTHSFFEPGIVEAWQSSLVPVITEEALSGNIYRGEYNNKAVADRLIATFPEGRVLIVIREQSDMILSVYKHRVRANLTVSIQEFLKPPISPGFEPLFRLEYLEYHWLISYYQKHLGKEKVLVLPYEMLKADRVGFLKKISDFTGADVPLELGQDIVNPGYSGLTVAMKRYFNLPYSSYARPNTSWYQRFNNSVFYKINNFIPKKLGDRFDRELESLIKDRLEEYYEYSNQMTAQLTGLDLKAYGYQI